MRSVCYKLSFLRFFMIWWWILPGAELKQHGKSNNNEISLTLCIAGDVQLLSRRGHLSLGGQRPSPDIGSS
ncbi:hypothetical protein BV898_17267 [Hypsibius exemplaris]|uniref:Secreted protein n=1 Tax=Hypsibius exemplaris TaxID=2072580 RepID=A0A9X6NNC1_HYPEX|nr:hypothetical protein BV898_17267 [Hypsibius exemplaris]